MTLLSPWSALAALGIGVPLLLLLYVLKLRRQRVRIASTLLWPRGTRDLEANVPFQRLRPSWLLLLQLLAVLLVAASLGRPVLEAVPARSARTILLIDVSASMSARDAPAPGSGSRVAPGRDNGGAGPSAGGGPTRLDAAKAAAREIVERLMRRREPGSVMVVAFGAAPRVVSGFQQGRRAILDAIDSIEPTDETADLAAALELAGAFARGDESTDQAPPEVVLISDGGVAGPPEEGGFRLGAGTLRFVGVGPAAGTPVKNVGIAAFGARREYDDPAQLMLFARLLNAGPEPQDVTATLRVDSEPAAIRSATVPGAGAGAGAAAGEGSVSFALELRRGAVVMLSLTGGDDLAADDTAAVVVAPPAPPRILLVHPESGPDPFLLGLVEALQPQRLSRLPVRAGEPAPPPPPEGDLDLIIVDRTPLSRLPPVPSIWFAALPPGVERDAAGGNDAVAGRRIVSWDRQHPLLRHVSLDPVAYAGAGALELPPEARALAWGPQGPVIALIPTRSARHVLVGFALERSTWPLDVGVAVFLQNALEFLRPGGAGGASGAGAGSVGDAESFAAGEPITVRSRPDADGLTVEGPAGTFRVEAPPASEVTLPALRLAGVYSVSGAREPRDRVAVNVAADVESDIRPRSSLTVNARATDAGQIGAAASLELWPLLAAGAMAILVLEWIVYCLRVAR